MTRSAPLFAAAVIVSLLSAAAPAHGPEGAHRPDAPAAAQAAPPQEGRERGGPDGRGDRGRPFTGEELDLALATLREIDPKTADQVEQLRRSDPQAAEQHVRRQFPRFRDFLSLKQRDPQMFDLRVQDLRLWRESRETAQAVAEARVNEDDARADELADRLEALAETHFDIRQQIRRRELERLESQLERLREQLEERADDKDELIEAHVADLIRGERSEW